jgi:predicted negative regulator of RcsB-dependent stress response
MANNLDLEEQEQLAELKHFWNQWGNLITWVLIAVFGAIAAFNGWNYWQRTQAAQAAALFDEIDRAAGANETARLERAFADMKDKFPRTAFAHQAGLLTARVLEEKGNKDAAKAALAWVAEHASDEGYRAVARLRLAALAVDAKAYDDALKQLSAAYPPEFEALAADRRGDVYNLQGKKAEAKGEYLKAWKGLGEDGEYRRLVEVKLTALGVDVRELAPAPANAASGAAKS